MNPKSLLALLLATLVLGGSALWLRRGGSRAAADEAPLVEGLAADLGDVARVELRGPDLAWTFARTDDGWTLLEKGGYPVRELPVATLARAVAEARRLERKTRNPERYGDLGLAVEDAAGDPADAEAADPDPDAPPAATRLRLLDADGATLADLWVGRRRTDAAEPATYVRLPDDPTCWVASGDLRPAPGLRSWVDPSVLALPAARIAAVSVEHPDGETLELVRDPEDDARLTLLEVPPGKELTGPWATSRFRSALQTLTLEDVSTDPLPEEGRTVARFWTEDGLRVDVTTVEVPGDAADGAAAGRPTASLLARVDVQVDPVVPSLLPGPVAPGAEPADLSAPDPEAEGPDEESDPQAVAEEAERLRARLSGWTFHLPGSLASTLRGRADALLKDLPEPEPEVTEPEVTEPEDTERGDTEPGDPEPVDPDAAANDDGGGDAGESAEDPGAGGDAGVDGTPAPPPADPDEVDGGDDGDGR